MADRTETTTSPQAPVSFGSVGRGEATVTSTSWAPAQDAVFEALAVPSERPTGSVASPC